MKIAFCVEDLSPSGGVAFVISHANYLATIPNNQVTIISRKDTNQEIKKIISLHENIITKNFDLRKVRNTKSNFDIVIGTFWKTYDFMFEVPATHYAFFIQSLESRFYPSDEFAYATEARIAQEIDIPIITIANWMIDAIKTQDPDRTIHLSRNGIDKDLFPVNQKPILASDTKKLEVIIEGSEAWFKGLKTTIDGICGVDFPINVKWFSITGNFDGILLEKISSNQHISLELKAGASQAEFYDALTNADLLIKSSIVEGLPGPPLEAFHAGCTGIFTNVTGISEYAHHCRNSILIPYGDSGAICNWLRILNGNRKLLVDLKKGALATAESWPSIRVSSIDFSDAINNIASDSNSSISISRRRELLAYVQTNLQRQRRIHKRAYGRNRSVSGIRISANAREYVLRGSK